MCPFKPQSPPLSPQIAAWGQTPLTALSLDPEEISPNPKKFRGEVEEGMKLPALDGLLGMTDLNQSSEWGTVPFFADEETRVGVGK